MKKKRKARKWKNSTDWPDYYLRRMLSWVCKELEFPVRQIKNVEFGNRKTCDWSGRAWSYNRILVRIGPADRFPCHARVYRDGFSVGRIADRVEALVKVTAHEVAHLDNGERGNRSRERGGWGGSERYTDAAAKRVLEAFRENRDALVAEWEKPPKCKPKKEPGPVEKRALKAFSKEAEYEKKLASAKRLLAKWRKKANYYRKKYPDGDYPEPSTERAPANLSPETVLKRKISKYITMAIDYADLKNCKLWIKVFYPDEGGEVLTRPSPNHEWNGFDIGIREARSLASLGDVLEVIGYKNEERWGDADIEIPPTEDDLNLCLSSASTWNCLRKAEAQTLARTENPVLIGKADSNG